jgi:putative ABC transport system permease protein
MFMRLIRRARYWLHSRRHAAELAEEMAFHRSKAGAPAFGNTTLAREDARDVWAFLNLERLWRDAVYGIRALRREPVFAITSLLTLTLGITAATTVFSVVDAELWKPLPFPQPERLIEARMLPPGPVWDYKAIAGADFADWRSSSRRAEVAAEGLTVRRKLRHQGATESVRVAPVSGNFFSALGLTPRIGRSFTIDDEREGRVAVLSDGAWRRLFGAAASVIGEHVAIDNVDYAVVGVTAGQHLEYRSEPDVFVCFDASTLENRTDRSLDIVARLTQGATIDAAQAELQAIADRIAAAFPIERVGYRVYAEGLREFYSRNNSRPLFFFLAAAAIVLVLSCLNTANLLLSRALRRQREFAIRGALGGGRAALARQMIVEAAVLAVPSAAAGLLLAMWTLRVAASSIPDDYLGRGGHFALDPRVAVFVTLVSAAMALALSLAPLTFARRVDLNLMLCQGAGRTAGRTPRQAAIRRAMLVGQLTMTLVLLVAAGLFVVSFGCLIRAPLGFDPSGRAAVTLVLNGSTFSTDAGRRDFARRLIEGARALPAITDAAVASSLPLSSGPVVRLVAADRPRPADGREPSAIIRAIDPAYFQALGIRQVSGRPFNGSDVAGAPRVAIINQYLAGLLFPGESAVGRVIDLVKARTPWTNRPGQLLVVGVTSNVKDVGINEVEFGNLYVPFEQAPATDLELVVRASIPPADVLSGLRRLVADLDPDVPMAQLSTMAQRVDEALKGDRFNLLLIGSFAALAIVLAAIGVYGAMACSVEERTREFGVRLALGQSPRALVRATLWESARLGITGGIIGLGIALIVARLIGSALYLVRGKHNGLLYGVTTTDPLVLGAAIAALVAVATLAGLMPARRATRVDPLLALRAE